MFGLITYVLIRSSIARVKDIQQQMNSVAAEERNLQQSEGPHPALRAMVQQFAN